MGTSGAKGEGVPSHDDESFQRACLDVAGGLVVGADHHVHLTAHDGGEGFAAALVGHMDQSVMLHAREIEHVLGGEVVDGAYAGAGVLQLAGIGLDVLDEFLQRLVGGVGDGP